MVLDEKEIYLQREGLALVELYGGDYTFAGNDDFSVAIATN